MQVTLKLITLKSPTYYCNLTYAYANCNILYERFRRYCCKCKFRILDFLKKRQRHETFFTRWGILCGWFTKFLLDLNNFLIFKIINPTTYVNDINQNIRNKHDPITNDSGNVSLSYKYVQYPSKKAERGRQKKMALCVMTIDEQESLRHLSLKMSRGYLKKGDD